MRVKYDCRTIDEKQSEFADRLIYRAECGLRDYRVGAISRQKFYGILRAAANLHGTILDDDRYGEWNRVVRAVNSIRARSHVKS